MFPIPQLPWLFDHVSPKGGEDSFLGSFYFANKKGQLLLALPLSMYSCIKYRFDDLMSGTVTLILQPHGDNVRKANELIIIQRKVRTCFPYCDSTAYVTSISATVWPLWDWGVGNRYEHEGHAACFIMTNKFFLPKLLAFRKLWQIIFLT